MASNAENDVTVENDQSKEISKSTLENDNEATYTDDYSQNEEPEQNGNAAGKDGSSFQDEGSVKNNDTNEEDGAEDNTKSKVSTESNNNGTEGEDDDENYFSVGYFLTKQGTAEEVKLHVDEIESDSDEEPEDDEEDLDDMDPTLHFARDGSVQRLDLPNKPSKKIADADSDHRSFSVGNFLKEDGTFEEVRIPLDELESDGEKKNDEEDFHEGTTYHIGKDGSLQKLFDDKTEGSCKPDDDNKPDDNN